VSALALRLRAEEASVGCWLETDWLRRVASLTRDCGRCVEPADEAVGGGASEASGRSQGAAVLRRSPSDGGLMLRRTQRQRGGGQAADGGSGLGGVA